MRQHSMNGRFAVLAVALLHQVMGQFVVNTIESLPEATLHLPIDTYGGSRPLPQNIDSFIYGPIGSGRKLPVVHDQFDAPPYPGWPYTYQGSEGYQGCRDGDYSSSVVTLPSSQINYPPLVSAVPFQYKPSPFVASTIPGFVVSPKPATNLLSFYGHDLNTGTMSGFPLRASGSPPGPSPLVLTIS